MPQVMELLSLAEWLQRTRLPLDEYLPVLHAYNASHVNDLAELSLVESADGLSASLLSNATVVPTDGQRQTLFSALKADSAKLVEDKEESVSARNACNACNVLNACNDSAILGQVEARALLSLALLMSCKSHVVAIMRTVAFVRSQHYSAWCRLSDLLLLSCVGAQEAQPPTEEEEMVFESMEEFKRATAGMGAPKKDEL